MYEPTDDLLDVPGAPLAESSEPPSGDGWKHRRRQQARQSSAEDDEADNDGRPLNPNDLAFWSFANSLNWAPVCPPPEPDPTEENVTMADPFEVRMRFSNQLQHLNASVVSAHKAAQYALKFKDMSEDLHSCILEQLERNSMNTRANIMYFIEPFLEIASKERHMDYVRMMQRDIIRVVDAVCPEDGSGAANVKVVRKVLHGLNDKGFLLNQTLTELEGCLNDRTSISNVDMGLSSPARGDAPMSTAPEQISVPRNSAPRLEKRQIEQRIEEDRERHKKLRESIWAVPQDEEAEISKFWDETSELGEDDHRLGREEWATYQKAAAECVCEHMRTDVQNGESKH